MKKNLFLRTGANAAFLCALLVAKSNAQTQTTVYDMANDVKHYSVENVLDPIVPGDVDEKVMAGTIYDFGTAGNNAIHFMTVQGDGTVLVSKYFDDPMYDQERVVDIVSDRAPGYPSTYYIISLARHPQVGTPPIGNDEIRITAVDVNGNQIGNSIILTDNGRSVYPLNAIYHSDGHIYICGYFTQNYTNLPQQPSFGDPDQKRGFVLKFNFATPTFTVGAIGINTATTVPWGPGTPTEDYDIAMRLTELSNGNIHVTGSVNDIKWNGVTEVYGSATMNLVIDQNLAVINDNHFTNVNGGYEYGMGLVEDPANSQYYVLGNDFTHTTGMGAYAGYDPEPTKLWVTRLDNNFDPVLTPGTNSRYSFTGFNAAWGLQTLESAGTPSNPAFRRFVIAGLQNAEHCSGVTIAPDVHPFLYDLEVDFTAAGGISANFINWVSYNNLTATGGGAPNGYQNLGGGLSNYAWNPQFAARLSTANDIVMSIPKWNAPNKLLNLKSVKADFSSFLEPNCPNSTTQYDGLTPCVTAPFYEEVAGNNYTPPPGMGEYSYVIKQYGPLSTVPTVSNPVTADYNVNSSLCDFGNRNYKTGISQTGTRKGLNVYPNPATDKITVALPHEAHTAGALKLQLTNIYGQVVSVLYEGNYASFRETMSLPVLPTGTYLLSVYTDGKSIGNVKISIH